MSDPTSAPPPDSKTRALVASAAMARARVAADVRELARELTPAELKERALDAAERSVESIAARALHRLAGVPRWLVSSARENPVAAGAAALGALLLVWKMARRHD